MLVHPQFGSFDQLCQASCFADVFRDWRESKSPRYVTSLFAVVLGITKGVHNNKITGA